ncbi:origin recognition complex subunit 3 N-terminus-domain-containing protein [Phakopsora pachyrhizi]|nr:origin recognition complex subunit 3 N-terminus-domain-containing protein [Phakopsora pachyrhizi]
MDKVNDIQVDILDDLVTLIKSLSFNSSGLIRKPIPTAVLIGSSSLLNASVVFRISNLRSLSGAYECLPVQLSSRVCLSFGATIRAIVDQLEIRLDHLKPTKTTRAGRTKTSLARDDVQNVRALYEEHCRHYLESARIDPDRVNQRPKLVLIIDDFEGFDSVVLEDLINVLGGLQGKVSVVLVLSVSTSADAIGSLLPRTALLRLQLTPFLVELGEKTVASIIKKIALSAEGSFDISPGVIRSLLNGYQHLNNSIDNLISKLQFIHLAHFYTNPLCNFFDSELNKSQSDTPSMVQKDMHLIALHLRLTGSWQSARVEEKKTDEEMFEILSESYRSRETSRKLTLVGIEALERLSGLWPEKGKTVEWVLYNIYCSELMSYAQEMCKLIKHSNDEMVLEVLNALSDMTEFEMVRENRLRLEELIADYQPRRAVGRTHLVNSHEPMMTGIKLIESDKEFSRIVADVSGFLSDFFRLHLGPQSLMKLHESWTFDDKILLNEVFHPPYVERIKSDLLNVKQLEGGERKESGGPTSLNELYKLYLDSNGKIINLMDWFGAFESLSSKKYQEDVQEKSKRMGGGSINKNPTRGKTGEDEREMDRRFLRGIGDLGFIGFVSGCSRKKEHLNKNVW